MKLAFLGRIALCFLLLLAKQGAAQSTTGTVTGVITDSAGAPVPQATVKLSSEATGFSQTATTNNDGAYVFPLVSPGSTRSLSNAKVSSVSSVRSHWRWPSRLESTRS